jgi:hypothetical protein
MCSPNLYCVGHPAPTARNPYPPPSRHVSPDWRAFSDLGSLSGCDTSHVIPKTIVGNLRWLRCEQLLWAKTCHKFDRAMPTTSIFGPWAARGPTREYGGINCMQKYATYIPMLCGCYISVPPKSRMTIPVLTRNATCKSKHAHIHTCREVYCKCDLKKKQEGGEEGGGIVGRAQRPPKAE